MKIKQEPTQAELRELFDYRGGQLIRRIATSSRARVGSVAGNAGNDKGYVYVSIRSKLYSVHRLIWIHHNGAIPEGAQIDHANGIRDDNRIDNLRLALNGNKDNGQNRTCNKNNKSGYMGVSWHKQTQKWVANIMVSNKQKHLGLFSTPEEAYAAYLKAKKELHKFQPEPRK